MSGNSSNPTSLDTTTGANQAHQTNDPKPPPDLSDKQALKDYQDQLGTYVLKWIERYEKLKFRSSLVIWSDFIDDFSVTAIINMTKDSLVSLRSVLMENNIDIKIGRGINMRRSMVSVLVAPDCPIVNQRNETNLDTDGTTDPKLKPRKTSAEQTKQVDIRAISAEPSNQTDEKSLTNFNNSNNRRYSDNTNHRNTTDYFQNKKNLESIVKAYVGRDKYAGNWDEDINDALEVFDLTCDMYELDDNSRRDGISIILKGPALSHYASNVKQLKTYEEVKSALRTWYTSDEKQSRLLDEWRKISMTKWMVRFPEKSQLSVFKDMVIHLQKLQRQLHSDYRKDRFLRDQLIVSADNPDISKLLRGVTFPTALAANQRIASLLSSAPGSASEFSNGISQDEVNVGIDHRFHGEAVKHPRGHSSRYRNRGGTSSKFSKVKGCWVCGKNHKARDHHPHSEIRKALEELKSKNAYVLADQVFEIFILAEEQDSDSANSD